MTIEKALEASIKYARREKPMTQNNHKGVIPDARYLLNRADHALKAHHCGIEEIGQMVARLDVFMKTHVLVPREPTKEMLYEGHAEAENDDQEGTRLIYKAMIKAHEEQADAKPTI